MSEKKSSKKQRREQEVLMGLIALYLRLGKHIGSNTLRENGFEHLSPATIRNYFASLESEGYLEQAHASGGRIPTHKALSLYAKEHLTVKEDESDAFASLTELEGRAVTKYLARAAELLSETSGYPAFFSSCRFDHDLITAIKLVQLDQKRLLCVIMTEFGQVLTEILSCKKKLSTFSLRRMESYFLWKLKGQSRPITLSNEEEAYASTLYNEIMVRYLVRYSNFSDEELYRTGFSRLLAYPELNDPVALTASLSLFENSRDLRLLLADGVKQGEVHFLIGQDLSPYGVGSGNCSVITITYRVGESVVGAFGLLGPVRMEYPKLFALLRGFSKVISKALTDALYKYKLSYRQPRSGAGYLEAEKEWSALDNKKLLEVKEDG